MPFGLRAGDLLKFVAVRLVMQCRLVIYTSRVASQSGLLVAILKCRFAPEQRWDTLVGRRDWDNVQRGL